MKTGMAVGLILALYLVAGMAFYGLYLWIRSAWLRSKRGMQFAVKLTAVPVVATLLPPLIGGRWAPYLFLVTTTAAVAVFIHLLVECRRNQT